MDALHLSIAFLPLAVYLLLLGWINLSGRPLVTTGARDLGALGVALCGFVVVGPMELFMPIEAAAKFGWFVWVLLLALYFVSLSLTVMLLSPRIVVYNATYDDVRLVLERILTEFDHEARWAGDSVSLPNVGMELHLDHLPLLRNVQLLAAGSTQNLAGWRQLELVLSDELAHVEVPPNPYGASMLLMAFMLLGMVSYFLLIDQQAVAQALRQMLRIS